MSLYINPSVQALLEIARSLSKEEIVVPMAYHDQVLQINKLLRNDSSGLVNSMLDFAIKSALVNYNIQTDNSNLTELLNNWLSKINYNLKNKIPVGIQALAKQYFIERWKKGSFCVLRTNWQNVDGMNLPVNMWLLDSADVHVENKDDVIKIGEEQYYLKIKDSQNKEKKIYVPFDKENTTTFIQKPFSAWTDKYPTPFIIQRGLYENMKFLDILNTKGQKLVNRAIEYLFLLKKGDKDLAKLGNPNFIYTEDELKKIKQELQEKIVANKADKGPNTYVSNFDTEIDHIIPEFNRILSQDVFAPIQISILSGLGLVEVMDGVTSSRKETILNPRPFMAEVNNAIEDFKQLLTDIIYEIMERNSNRRKYANKTVRVYSSQPQEFITDDIRAHLRAAYDRGQLSHQTYIEDVCRGNYFQEIERRKKEAEDGIDDLLYPHIVQNQEQHPDDKDAANPSKPKDEDILDDRSGPEKKNFLMNEYEESPYKKNQELPDSIKDNMSSELQTIFRNVVNESLDNGDSEEVAFKKAWATIKKVAKKDKKTQKWVMKS